MGRATVVEELGGGQYRVALDYGSTVVADRVGVIDAQVTILTDQIAILNSNLATANSAVAAALADLDAAIVALRAVIESGGDYDEEQTAAQEAAVAAIVAQKNADILESHIAGLESQKAALLLEKTALQALELETEIEAWCADYTGGLVADDTVATLEVPGDPTLTLIAPGGPTPTNADGLVLAREVQQPHQAYFNACIFNGWQKWMPTYRLGEITTITGDTCNLALDPVTSTGQNLNANQAETLADVPIEYMTCNGAVFQAGDRVVVAFTDQDWAQPKVIGFESAPRPCLGFVFTVIDNTTGNPASGDAVYPHDMLPISPVRNATGLPVMNPGAAVSRGTPALTGTFIGTSFSWVNPWNGAAVSWTGSGVYYRGQLIVSYGGTLQAAWVYNGKLYGLYRLSSLLVLSKYTLNGTLDGILASAPHYSGASIYWPHIAPNGRACVVITDKSVHRFTVAEDGDSATVSHNGNDSAYDPGDGLTGVDLALAQANWSHNVTIEVNGRWTGTAEADWHTWEPLYCDIDVDRTRDVLITPEEDRYDRLQLTLTYSGAGVSATVGYDVDTYGGFESGTATGTSIYQVEPNTEYTVSENISVNADAGSETTTVSGSGRVLAVGATIVATGASYAENGSFGFPKSFMDNLLCDVASTLRVESYNSSYGVSLMTSPHRVTLGALIAGKAALININAPSSWGYGALSPNRTKYIGWWSGQAATPLASLVDYYAVQPADTIEDIGIY